MKSILIAVLGIGLLSSAALAGPEPEHRGHMTKSGLWQMNDIGRNHGVIGGAFAKCNPYVSPECARLYPQLLKRPPWGARGSEYR